MAKYGQIVTVHPPQGRSQNIYGCLILLMRTCNNIQPESLHTPKSIKWCKKQKYNQNKDACVQNTNPLQYGSHILVDNN